MFACFKAVGKGVERRIMTEMVSVEKCILQTVRKGAVLIKEQSKTPIRKTCWWNIV